MNKKVLLTRIGLTAFYFAVAFGILFLFTQGSPFCRAPNGHFISTVRLALGCTVWYVISSLLGLVTFHFFKSPRIFAISISVIVTYIGLASLPDMLFIGYGHYHFENTIADVGCFFTEGWGIAFPFISAPLLAAATLLCEYLAYRATRKHTAPTS
jgi:hypothetical protein